MANLTKERARFDAARTAWRKARARYLELRAEAERKYPYSQPFGVRARLQAALDREFAKSNAFFALLDAVSPRDWHSTVPAFWILENLTWEDALTSAALSVLPPAGYGTTQEVVREFAAPVLGGRA